MLMRNSANAAAANAAAANGKFEFESDEGSVACDACSGADTNRTELSECSECSGAGTQITELSDCSACSDDEGVVPVDFASVAIATKHANEASNIDAFHTIIDTVATSTSAASSSYALPMATPATATVVTPGTAHKKETASERRKRKKKGKINRATMGTPPSVRSSGVQQMSDTQQRVRRRKLIKKRCAWLKDNPGANPDDMPEDIKKLPCGRTMQGTNAQSGPIEK